MIALDTEIIFFLKFERTTNFRFNFYSYTYKLDKRAGRVV